MRKTESPKNGGAQKKGLQKDTADQKAAAVEDLTENTSPPPENQPEDSQESKPLTVNGFLALLGKMLNPVLDADMSLNGEPVRDIYGYEVVVQNDHAYVNVRTREAPNAADRN